MKMARKKLCIWWVELGKKSSILFDDRVYRNYELKTFNAVSELLSIKRIQLRNIIPVNMQNPIRSMGTKE